MEIWATTGQEALDEAVATGKVENVGETGLQAIEEWWYPLYMKERCLGLPDWKALKACASEFATPETGPKGPYVGGPVTWGAVMDAGTDGSDDGIPAHTKIFEVDSQVVAAGKPLKVVDENGQPVGAIDAQRVIDVLVGNGA